MAIKSPSANARQIVKKELEAVRDFNFFTAHEQSGRSEKILWGDIHSYKDFFQHSILIVGLIRLGVSYPLFALIQHEAPFDDAGWSEILGISTKTLQRHKQLGSSFKFKPLQSERILEMAEVTSLGMDVFGDMEKFRLWLQTPSFSLGGITPMELLKDSYGKEMVIAELTRAQHGIFA